MASLSSIELSPEQVRRHILRERARRLAVEDTRDESGSAASLEVVEFELAGGRYAVESRSVREVYAVRTVTPLPCAPPHVLGIINVRGQIVPIVDLRRILGLNDTAGNVHTIIITRDTIAEVGIHVDVMVGAYDLRDPFQEGPVTLAGPRGDFLRGVTANRLALLDLGAIVAATRLAPSAPVTTEETEDA